MGYCHRKNTENKVMSPEMVAVILFIFIFLVLLSGYPVAFVLGGLSVLVGWLYVPDFLDFLPLRIMGTMQNYVLLAVPLFIFMGLVLEKSGIAEDLLNSMGFAFGRLKGGLAISVIIVGTLLAASTGIVGATVISMGLISLPIMLKKGYSPSLSTGIIAGSGTLGQIIPPSVVLILLSSVLNVSVGVLFKAAIIPGLLIVLGYVLFIFIYGWFYPEKVPALSEADLIAFKQGNFRRRLLESLLFPLILILAVLGSIFAGIASPTEAAAVGSAGALLLTLIKKRFSYVLLRDVCREATFLTSMVFMILLGATTFALVFRGLGGDHFLVSWIEASELSPSQFLFLVMVLVFVSGFFIDFIEIIFIVVPIVAPIFVQFQMDPVWIGILLALNLQTSFLTPPFGFALFYLKGVAPPGVKTTDIYKGIIPFICIQLLVLGCIYLWPDILYGIK
jgi:tripartite ATP-independent transporter DctM subunit